MAEYTLPNWLNRPTDTITPLLHGMQMGQTIAAERNRLQQQAHIAGMEAQSRHEALQQRMLMEQQQIEFDKAKQQAMQQLRERELALEQEKVDVAVKTYAQKSAAQLRAQQRIQAGEDAAKVYLEEGMMMGMPMSGAASLYRARQPVGPTGPPEDYTTPEGVKWNRIPGAGAGGRDMWQQPRVHPSQAAPLTAPLPTQPVLDAQGNPIPGKAAYSGATGPRIITTPDRSAALAEKRLAAMAKNYIFMNLMNRQKQPTQAKGEKKEDYDKRLQAFRDWVQEYVRLKKVVDRAINTGAGGLPGQPADEEEELDQEDGVTPEMYTRPPDSEQ